MNSLPTYIKKNKAVIGLEREPINGKRYNDNLCLFRCLALHRGGDVRHLESGVTKLYETYKQDDDVPMEEFAGVTLEDLYRIETTFQTNVCVYKLVESDDDDDGKKIAVRLLPTTRHRHVQAGHQRTRSDLALPVQRSSGEDVLYALQREE